MINGQRRGTTNQESKSEALKLKGANKPSSKRSRREWEDWQNGEKINSVRKEIQMGCVWIIELENKYMVNTKQRWAYHRQYRLECRTHSLNPELEINEFMLKNSPDSASSCRLTARLSIMCGIYIYKKALAPLPLRHDSNDSCYHSHLDRQFVTKIF